MKLTLKSYVKPHTRIDPSGKVVQVSAYTDKRTKKPEAAGASGAYAYRISRRAVNSVRVLPPVGKQFDEQTLAEMQTKLKEAGASVIQQGSGLHVIDDDAWSLVESTLPMKQTKSMTLALQKREAIEEQANKRKSDNQSYLASSPSVPWIESVFGKDFENQHNLTALAKFLDGAERKFEGVASWKWQDGIEKVGAYTEDKKSIDWKKLKDAYEQSKRGHATSPVLTPEEQETEYDVVTMKDAPLNPKVKPLVNALNRAGIGTTMSGDAYGEKLVYVDIRPSDMDKLNRDGLPDGWKVTYPHMPHMERDVLGEPMNEGHQRQAPLIEETSALCRLSRKGGAVTEAEVKAIVRAFQDKQAAPDAPAFTLRSRKAGDGIAHQIMVGKNRVGHISGFDKHGSFHIYKTELDEAHRGSGLYQRAIQQVADQYPHGAYVHSWESSTALKRALRKMSTMRTDNDKVRVSPTGPSTTSQANKEPQPVAKEEPKASGLLSGHERRKLDGFRKLIGYAEDHLERLEAPGGNVGRPAIKGPNGRRLEKPLSKKDIDQMRSDLEYMKREVNELSERERTPNPGEQLSLFKGLTLTFKNMGQQVKTFVLNGLAKAHVKAYQRTSSSGQVVQVKDHEDKRAAARARFKKPRAKASLVLPGRKRSAAADKESDGNAAPQPTSQGEGADTELANERPQTAQDPLPAFTPTPHPTSEEETEAWLEAVMKDPDIARAIESNLAGTSTDHIHKQADGTYTPERQQLHQAIVSSMLNPKAQAEPGVKPHVVILMGCPGAGKTTTLAPIAKEYGVEFTTVNADDVKAKLPEYNGSNAGLVHEESSDIAEGQLFPQAMQARHHLVMDITGANGKKVKAMVEQFHGHGYEISIAYAHLPAWKAATRVVDRFRKAGRFVPPTYVVNKVDGNPEETYNDLKNDPRVSHWRRYNNDVTKGTEAPLQEQGQRNRGESAGSTQSASLVKAVHRRPVRAYGRPTHGQDPAGLPETIQHAYRLKSALTKSLIYLSDDLASPDLDPCSRGILLAERLRTRTQLDQLTQKLHEVTDA